MKSVYRRSEFYKPLLGICGKKKCAVSSCLKLVVRNGYCHMHSEQVRLFGKIRMRTMMTPNIFRISKDICTISIYNRKCEKVATTIIDKEDYILAKKYKWHYRSGYIGSHDSNKRTICLSHLLINPPDGFYVDHKDHNTLNNRRTNLRLATSSQSNMNRRKMHNNKSGCSGVNCIKSKNKIIWIARISVNNKRIFLGRFNKLSDAIYIRKEAEKKYFGDFRCEN